MTESNSFLLADITFCIKTIHRPRSCNRLIKSIRQYVNTAKIHVLDDGKPELRFSVEHPEAAASIDSLIEADEFDIGISAGRNRLHESVTTPHFILLDDDHVFTEATRVNDMFARFRQLEDRLDLLAFGDTSVPRCFSMHEPTRTMYAENHAHAVDDDGHQHPKPQSSSNHRHPFTRGRSSRPTIHTISRPTTPTHTACHPDNPKPQLHPAEAHQAKSGCDRI